MADNRFRLLRLPFLALCRILDFYKIHDIIQLSLCSKRSLQIAKKCWKKKGSVTAHLTVEAVPSIHFYFPGDPLRYRFFISGVQDIHDKQTHNIRVGDAVVLSIHKKTETVTFWEDKIYGMGQIIGYLKDFFDDPIDSIDLTAEEHPNEFIRTIDCVMNRQESVEECFFRGGASNDCITHLLDNLKITGDLRIFGELSPQFNHDWKIHLNGLHLKNGLCFTFQNLTNIDCQALDLPTSSLTSEDLNQFLKNWQKGGNPRLRYASIRINSMNHDIVTSGIETAPMPQGISRSYPFMRNSTMIIMVGLDIKRNDGTTGTIHLFENSFGFGVDPEEIKSNRY